METFTDARGGEHRVRSTTASGLLTRDEDAAGGDHAARALGGRGRLPRDPDHRAHRRARPHPDLRGARPAGGRDGPAARPTRPAASPRSSRGPTARRPPPTPTARSSTARRARTRGGTSTSRRSRRCGSRRPAGARGSTTATRTRDAVRPARPVQLHDAHRRRRPRTAAPRPTRSTARPAGMTTTTPAGRQQAR